MGVFFRWLRRFLPPSRRANRVSWTPIAAPRGTRRSSSLRSRRLIFLLAGGGKSRAARRVDNALSYSAEITGPAMASCLSTSIGAGSSVVAVDAAPVASAAARHVQAKADDTRPRNGRRRKLAVPRLLALNFHVAYENRIQYF